MAKKASSNGVSTALIVAPTTELTKRRKRRRTRSYIDYKEFVTSYLKAHADEKTVKQFAASLGVKPEVIYARICYLRAKGLALPKLGRLPRHRINIAELKTIVEKFKRTHNV